MSTQAKILIIDDVYGKVISEGRNNSRNDLCGKLLLNDISHDHPQTNTLKVKRPLADAVFFRGQTPICSKPGDTVENDLQTTLEVIRKGWFTESTGEVPWSMVLIDLNFKTGQVTEASNQENQGQPEGKDEDKTLFGLQICKALQQEMPDLPYYILSGEDRSEVSQQFTRYGALGFISRSDPKGDKALKQCMWEDGLIPDHTNTIIGHSKSLLFALRSARRAARTDKDILLEGEKGTGKELIAAYIHNIRKEEQTDRPFVKIDCGALSRELYQSTLFGHKKGDFTGAVTNKEGKIKQADGGDLFFDEISKMPLDVQDGLLRMGQEKEITMAGGDVKKINVRIISASNENLKEYAEQGLFHPDLYDRLESVGAKILLPPLRDRQQDIKQLADYFLQKALKEIQGARYRVMTPKVVKKLQSCHWSGNIRDFEKTINKAVNDYKNVEHIEPHHIVLPEEVSYKSYKKSNNIDPYQSGVKKKEQAIELTEFLDIMESFDFSENNVSGLELEGLLPRLRKIHAKQLGMYFAAVLAFRAKVDQLPEGNVQYTKAFKWALADNSVKPTKAKREIVNWFKGFPESAFEEAVEDIRDNHLVKNLLDKLVK